MSDAENTPRAGELFATTRWTQVLAARTQSPAARAALSDLCAAYYAPVHAYIARTAHDLGDARDLTHEFFAGLLAGRMLGGAERAKGRFRGYLLGAVKHFLADTRDRLHAKKRGAQHEHVSIAHDPEATFGVEPSQTEDHVRDAWFDRQWGIAVLDRALAALAEEHEAQDKRAQFELLKSSLTGEASGGDQAKIAAALGMSEGAVKVAIHRLRKRFRECVKAEIAQTVSDEAEVREELRYLIEVVS